MMTELESSNYELTNNEYIYVIAIIKQSINMTHDIIFNSVKFYWIIFNTDVVSVASVQLLQTLKSLLNNDFIISDINEQKKLNQWSILFQQNLFHQWPN